MTVIDVRTPGEFASGHVPGARNVPLDRLEEAMPALEAAAARGPLLVVCASGARSGRACEALTAAGITAVATMTGGTTAWAAEGHDLKRPEGGRAVWPMERQVRLAAGGLVLLGVGVAQVWAPAQWLAAGVGAGLAFSAVSGTCGMAALLARLPHNRRAGNGEDFDRTLNDLHR
ncbi:rhodanese-like domain-containing protein [Streptomyces sp. ACA25]|uniref:rhodanese-like domain-containing protein n=1 Tax=Streptomyces sp. ACA25 TaxID=3022596 RepID=UPI002307F0C3|nr:rhodanese-like domain-containing protein [Streptomyces sp. ACA25]MDB1087282.1 rhodanese-like domain-containing protein [Streptomyces sp. ACA25]